MPNEQRLSKRESQVMDAVLTLGGATAREVLDHLGGKLSYSAVRSCLRILVKKGQLVQSQDGPRARYRPKTGVKTHQRRTMRRVIQTLFGGSTDLAIATLLKMEGKNLTKSELEELEGLIAEAKRSALETPSPSSEDD